MVRRVRADRERQSMAIDNRHDFHAFSALRSSDFQPATLGHDEGCVDEAFFFVQYASIAKLVGNIRQRATQNLIAAPSLKAPMHGFVVRVALRQHVPLRACVENPQDCFEHTTRWSRFAPRTSIGNILLRKMIPDAFPLLVREPNHSTFISDRQQGGNFEIGSNISSDNICILILRFEMRPVRAPFSTSPNEYSPGVRPKGPRCGRQYRKTHDEKSSALGEPERSRSEL